MHREVVSISPHHIYAEGVQSGFHHNLAQVAQTTTPNVNSFPVSQRSQMSQPQPQQPVPQVSTQQQINTSNATNLSFSMQSLNLMDSNVVYVNSDGIPMIRKSESDSISSGESIEESTSPDTPLNADNISSSGVSGGGGGVGSNSSINKKFKVRGDPKSSSRHKVPAQHQPQQLVFTHVSTPMSSEIVLTPNVTQTQSQQTITQIQPTPQSIQSINSSIGLANTPSVIYHQQYGQPTHPMQKSQMNQTYPYPQPHIPMNNRPSIMQPNTTTSTAQPAPTYHVPSFHMQPNGDMVYQVKTYAYVSPPALSLTRPPSTCNQTHVVPTPPLTMQHLPTLTSLSSKSNQNTMVSPFLLANDNAKPNTSCFNCGSSSHTGQECQEASMEDVTRGIYKLDYNNSTIQNDNVKTATELDNGSGVKTTDSITHMSPSVLNK